MERPSRIFVLCVVFNLYGEGAMCDHGGRVLLDTCNGQNFNPSQYYCLALPDGSTALCPSGAPCACPTPAALAAGGAPYGCYNPSQYHCTTDDPENGLVPGFGVSNAGACPQNTSTTAAVSAAVVSAAVGRQVVPAASALAPAPAPGPQHAAVLPTSQPVIGAQAQPVPVSPFETTVATPGPPATTAKAPPVPTPGPPATTAMPTPVPTPGPPATTAKLPPVPTPGPPATTAMPTPVPTMAILTPPPTTATLAGCCATYPTNLQVGKSAGINAVTVAAISAASCSSTFGASGGAFIENAGYCYVPYKATCAAVIAEGVDSPAGGALLRYDTCDSGTTTTADSLVQTYYSASSTSTCLQPHLHPTHLQLDPWAVCHQTVPKPARLSVRLSSNIMAQVHTSAPVPCVVLPVSVIWASSSGCRTFHKVPLPRVRFVEPSGENLGSLAGHHRTLRKVLVLCVPATVTGASRCLLLPLLHGFDVSYCKGRRLPPPLASLRFVWDQHNGDIMIIFLGFTP